MRRLIVFTLTLWLVAALPALAAHRPSHRSRARMNAAVRRSPLMPPPIRHGRFHLREARVSTRGPWSKATVVPAGTLKRRLDSVLTIFHRHGAGWRVVGLGTAEVGCDHPRLPRKVRRDLHLSCPPARSASPVAGRASGRRCHKVRTAGRTARRVRVWEASAAVPRAATCTTGCSAASRTTKSPGTATCPGPASSAR